MIPVFVFPESLVLSARSRTQSLSVYNPYDFAVKFNILATNPDLFSLSASEGVIRSRHCLDVAVRLTRDVIGQQKLLISVRETSGAHRSGQRVVTVTAQEPADGPDDHFAPIAPTLAPPPPQRQLDAAAGHSQWLILAAAAVCLAVLLLPNESAVESLVTVAVAHKLVVSYVLGLLTVVWINDRRN